GVIDDAGGEFGAEDAVNVVVELGLRNLSSLQSSFEFVAEEQAERLFIVEPSGGRFDRAVGGSPVGDDEAWEVPIVFEEIGKEPFVLAGVLAVNKIVGAHDSARLADFDANLECQQIRLAHGAAVNDDVDRVAAGFLIVEREMLDMADDVLGLLAFDPVADERAGEDGIFAHVFKGATVARLASSVDAA